MNNESFVVNILYFYWIVLTINVIVCMLGLFSLLQMISQSVRQVVLDVKVGPPSFEKGLAEDVLSLVSSVYLFFLFCLASNGLL